VTLGVFGVIVVRKNAGKKRTLVAFLVIIVLLASTILWFGRGELMERLGRLGEVAVRPEADYRFIVTTDALRMFHETSLFGCGFGSFRHVYPIFQSPSLAYRWLHVHNDWAQLLAEGGLVGTLLFLAAVALWARTIAGRFARASKRGSLLVLGILFGLTTIALHSFVDYGLHKPANAFLLAALAGMAVAGVHLRRGERPEKTPPPKAWPLVAGERLLALGAIAGLALFSFSALGQCRGELALSRFLYLRDVAERAKSDSTRQKIISGAHHEANLVTRYAGQNADGLAEVVAALVEWGCDPAFEHEFTTDMRVRASQMAIRAVSAAPSDYLKWLWLARARILLGDVDGAAAYVKTARALVQNSRQVRMFAREESEEITEGHPAYMAGPLTNLPARSLQEQP